MLVDPFIMLPKSVGVSHVTSASIAPTMVMVNGYAALAKIMLAIIDPEAVVKVTDVLTDVVE
jgi:hypothetical protein